MAPRPYWKGYLKLSLVSCAVALYPASSKSERISFHWLNRGTGNRLRQLMVDTDTNETVEREDRVRGYQLSKNDYLEIEEEDLDAIEIESSHTIEIESFVPRLEIDPVYLDSPYYLAPNDKVAEEAFAVIREAMKAADVVGLGRAVISRRERLFALEPRDKGILATSLRYNYEVRSDRAYFDEIPDLKVPNEMRELATHIIRTKMGHFDISKFEDRYESALIEMIRAKQAGRPIEHAPPPRPTNVINLMDALRNSIAAEKGGFKEPAGGMKVEAPKTTKRASRTSQAVRPPASDGAKPLREASKAAPGRGREKDRPVAQTPSKAKRKVAGRR
jgi:DNA end-binding protein Ku